jgi:hypothetical protein
MRLIRTILLLTGVGVLLPAPPEDAAAPKPVVAEQVSTLEMLSSASSALTDMGSFCIRQPGVCQTATYVAGRLEAKAKYSARLIYEWASDATSDPTLPVRSQEATGVDMLNTGTMQLALSSPEKKKSQSTLKLEDVIPEWRGPAEAKKKEG